MLTEKQVRARIKECKAEIKFCKSVLSGEYWYSCKDIHKREIRYQKEKLKRLRRELPMLARKSFSLDGYYDLHCPICGNYVGACDDYTYDVQIFDYCSHCGQRVRSEEE